MLLEAPLDRTAELDSTETIETLRQAIASHGHDVQLLEADIDAYEYLRKSRADLVFNIAEGTHGEDRESQIPAMLEMLGLPYTGSGPLALALCLHKGKAKEILSWYGIPTPPFRVASCLEDLDDFDCPYPRIVKLLHEGSSMGLSYDAVVETRCALARRVAYVTQAYHQPAIVEQFIDGREFTVPVLGNNPPTALPVIEVCFRGPRPITLFQPDDPIILRYAQAHGQRIAEPVTYRLSADAERAWIRTEAGGEIAIPVSLTTSVCPADIPAELAAALQATAVRAFQALECRDWGRVDMRVGADGIPQVLELNPIAGIDPTYWFPRSAAAAGMDYAALIGAIIQAACHRYGL
jgi:D-alanine-D-alanine ligase